MPKNAGTETNTTITQVVLLGLSSNRRTQLALFASILVTYAVTMVSNLLIILLVLLDSRLHTPMYFFLSNFSGLEMCFVSSIVPQMLAHMLAGSGLMSFKSCIAQMYFAAALGCTEGLLLGAMAYGRYLAICRPLTYATAMSWGHSVGLAVASWTPAFLLSGITTASILRLPFCGPNRLNHFFCDYIMVIKLGCTSNAQWAELTVIAMVTVILLIPFLAILTSYVLILVAVMRMSSGAGRNKAFSTCASHLLVVVMFYWTILVLYLRPQSDSTNNKYITLFYVVVTPLLNPVIYTLRNKDIHAAASKVLHS